MAKEFERVGLPTVLATCLFTVATRVGANRIVRGGRFHHPFGDPQRSPQEEYIWRRAFVEQILQVLGTPVQQPTVFDVEAPVQAQ